MQLRSFEGVAGKRDQYQIDPRLLKVRPNFNIRDLTTPAAREKLDKLKAQIKAEGVLEAIEIEFDGETPWINEGHRRHIVVMELIEEGHDFKSVPCIQERSPTKADKRTLHMLMRQKEDYEPLEYARGVERMVNVFGWDKSKLATELGFKSKASIDDYLEMVALPAPIQTHINNGEISATLARNIAKGVDPEYAEKLIRDNLEENKRLGVGKRTKHKVTPKTINRNKPKPDSPKPESAQQVAGGSEPASRANPLPVVPASPSTPAYTEPLTSTPTYTEPTPTQLPPADGWEHFDSTPAVAHVATRPTQTKELIEALEPFATLAHEHDFTERADDDVVEVPFRHLKKAWVVFAKVVGEAA